MWDKKGMTEAGGSQVTHQLDPYSQLAGEVGGPQHTHTGHGGTGDRITGLEASLDRNLDPVVYK